MVETGHGLVGRDRELGELTDAVAAAATSGGAVFLVSGEAGIGKTSLVDAVATAAASRGHLIVSGRTWESGGAPPFWPWTQVLRACEAKVEPGLLIEAGGSSRPTELLGEPTSRSPDTSPEGRFDLYDAVTAFLLGLADAVPLTIVLEDLHAADEPSLHLLRFAARQLRGSRVVILGTFREAEASAHPAVSKLLTDAARDGHHLPLRGLDVGAVAALVTELTGEAHDELSAELHDRTAGNPLFLLEILRLRAAGDATTRVPLAVREAIRRRTAALPTSARGLLADASVIGRRFGTTLLQRLSDVGASDVVDLLRVAEEARIVVSTQTVGSYRFTHELLRETLYTDLPQRVRMERHARLVDILEDVYATDRDTHLSEIAHHAVAAVPVGDPGQALQYLLEAAEYAHRTLAHEEAARLLRQALALAEHGGWDEQQRAEALMRLMEVELAAGRLYEVAELHEEVATLARRHRLPAVLARAALTRGAVVYSVWKSQPESIAALEEALEMLPADDLELRPLVLARLVAHLGYYVDVPIASLADEMLLAARASGDPATMLLAAVAKRHATRAEPIPAERLVLLDEALREAPRCGNRVAVGQARYARLNELLLLGDIDEYERELERLRGEARASCSLLLNWHATSSGVVPLLLRGEWHRAQTEADEAAALGSRIESPLALSVWGVQIYLLMRERDDLEQLWQVGQSLLPAFRDAPVTRCAFMWLAAIMGKGDHARSTLDHVAADGYAALPIDSSRYCALAFTAATAVELGDVERAQQLVAMLEPYAGLLVHGGAWAAYGPFDLYLGRLYGLLDDWDRAERSLDSALALTVRMGSRPWEAHVRLELARLLRARGADGDHDRAAELLEAVIVATTELEMHHVARLARELRDETPAAAARGRRLPRDVGLAKEGEYWTVDGTVTFRLRDTKGLRYLAQLLANPDVEIHVMTLSASDHVGTTRTATEDGLAKGFPSDAGPVLDAEAKTAYRRRVRDLQEEIDEATGFNDLERASRAQEELDFLRAELARATGLGGRDRRAASPVEQARINVTKTIRAALRRISQNDPELGAYLSQTVRTGMRCAYEPSRLAASSSTSPR